MRFKKGEFTDEAFKVLMYDLESLKDNFRYKEQFDYHFKLLKGNLKDLFGVGVIRELEKRFK